MGALDFRLLNDFQRDFPLRTEPYRELAMRLGTDEPAVVEALRRLRREGKVSRVGATFRPGAVGASMLCAMAAPPARIAGIAARVSAFSEVNHNYEREHAINLWFVVSAADESALADAVSRIEAAAGLAAYRLPLLAEYHIDLGFDLGRDLDRDGGCGARPEGSDGGRASLRVLRVSPRERTLIAALGEGLALDSRPFAALGERCGMDEAQIIATLERWIAAGAIRRFGVIVRHHELGYTENAMVVWNVADAEVDELGRRLARSGAVTLCYRRARALPAWPYNLYCMIHGDNRDRVMREIDTLEQRCGLQGRGRQTLFSINRFKQQGARYAAAG